MKSPQVSSLDCFAEKFDIHITLLTNPSFLIFKISLLKKMISELF